MKSLIISLIAFIGGISLALQAGFNSQLSTILKQPVFVAIITSISSAFFALIYLLLFGTGLPQSKNISMVPWHLWLIGGFFSVLGISLYFYTIPKLGISKMITLGLCGQLTFSILAGNFGWFNLPVEPLTTRKVMGAIALIIGIILINSK